MSDRKALNRKFRNYFYGDLPALHAGFLERFKDPAVTQALSLQSFVAQNEIRAIVEKRCSLVPLKGIEFSVTDPGDESPRPSLTKWLRAWLAGENFGDGRSFFDFAAEVLACLELDGEVALKLILRKGTPLIRRIPDESLEILTRQDNIFEITGFAATYAREIEGEDFRSQALIEERITDSEYVILRDGKTTTQKHPFGFIPVVLIKREDVEGSPHGRSGIADLIEPQDNLNRCLTNIARANKYGPWGLYCTEDTGAPLPDGDVTVAPGALVATPIRKVSGDGAAECLFREKQETIDAMYRIAGLSRNKAEEIADAGRTSGKAMLVLNAQGKRYVSNLIARLCRGFARMGACALAMGGLIHDPEKARVDVSFASLDREDPSVGIEKAKLLAAMELPAEALIAMGYDREQATRLLEFRSDKIDSDLKTNA